MDARRFRDAHSLDEESPEQGYRVVPRRRRARPPGRPGPLRSDGDAVEQARPGFPIALQKGISVEIAGSDAERHPHGHSCTRPPARGSAREAFDSAPGSIIPDPVPGTLVDRPDALALALDAIRRAPTIALDTETDAFFAYRARICLLQVSVPGADLLVDPLARLDLAPFGALLADPAREVVLHAAENDVILLQHQLGWRIARLFDTQVACFALGLKPYSLAGVLEERFGVKLDKSMQRSDWSRRPLSAEQVAYATEDTSHLLALAAELHGRLQAAGRVEEVASECARIAARTWAPEPYDPDGFRRIDGVRLLDRTQQRILRDLHRFRESESERMNRAPYRVVDDRALFAIAEARAKDWVRGVPRKFWDRYGREVVRVVDAALAKGPIEARPPREGRPEPLPMPVRRAYDLLRKWRGEAAERRGVEPFVVARNEALMEVAKRGCRSLSELGEVLEPFRVREYGEAMLAAMLDSPAERAQNAG